VSAVPVILMPRSLQARLLVLVLGVMTGVWLAGALATWFDARVELDELLDGHLAQAASLLIVQQTHAVEAETLVHGHPDEAPYPDAPLLHRYSPRVAFQVYRGQRLIARSTNAPRVPMIDLDEQFYSGFRSVTLDSPATRDPDAGLTPTRWRVFAARGIDQGVQVYVGERVDSRSEILRAVLRSTLWPMLLSLPLLGLSAWWAIYRGVAPLRQLGRQLAQRRPLDLQPVTVDRAPAEMEPMLEALNQLFVRITELMQAERRFTADAAHELRTPIAAIRAQAQVALGESRLAERHHALQATLEGCDRATRLVEQLLTLSRLEAGVGLDMVVLDLSALVRQELAQLAPSALDKDQTLEFHTDADLACLVHGNATLWAVLLRNVVGNAIRYCPEGATVALRLSQAAGRARLIIEDSGPGLAPADLRRLGERFFRVLGSGQSGSGLGWSIVRRVAAVHQLQLQIGRGAEFGGLSVTLECPTVSEAGPIKGAA